MPALRSRKSCSLTVPLVGRSYPIHIGPGLLSRPEVLARAIGRGVRDVLLVSNTIVMPLYGERVRTSLLRAGPRASRPPQRRIIEVVLPDGEAHKTLGTVARILDVLVANRFGRDACVIALGGGVVGDVAGYAAASYQRGIDVVQIPTTLLAQVDSAVGGKTGVNHPGGKNLIGAFHQPRAVITDTATLATLPPRELRAGLAEVIKYGLLGDAAFFDWLEAGALERLLALEPEALATAIHRCCALKARIVGRDERERHAGGPRALLNLGHTFGHAIEAVAGYDGSWLHGEAVGAGLAMAAEMSQRAGLLKPQRARRATTPAPSRRAPNRRPAKRVDALAHDPLTRIESLLRRADLATQAPQIDARAALEAMRIDKKAAAGTLRFVLLERIGRAILTSDYPARALQSTLASRFGNSAGRDGVSAETSAA